MAKKITIPRSYGYPYCKVWINSKEYVLPTGEEIEVEDCVAALFEQIESEAAKYEPEDYGRVVIGPASGSIGRCLVVKAVDENGKPSEWEAVDLPKASVPDWTVNDESAEGYVKGRTHYYIPPVLTTIIPEQEVTSDSNKQISYPEDAVSGEYWEKLLDETVKDHIVTFNGIEYRCAVTSDGRYGRSMGNESLADSTDFDNGMPFYLEWANNSDSYAWLYVQEANTTYTIKIDEVTTPEVWEVLDERYIPETIARVTDVDAAKAYADDKVNALADELTEGVYGWKVLRFTPWIADNSTVDDSGRYSEQSKQILISGSDELYRVYDNSNTPIIEYEGYSYQVSEGVYGFGDPDLTKYGVYIETNTNEGEELTTIYVSRKGDGSAPARMFWLYKWDVVNRQLDLADVDSPRLLPPMLTEEYAQEVVTFTRAYGDTDAGAEQLYVTTPANTDNIMDVYFTEGTPYRIVCYNTDGSTSWSIDGTWKKYTHADLEDQSVAFYEDYYGLTHKFVNTAGETIGIGTGENCIVIYEEVNYSVMGGAGNTTVSCHVVFYEHRYVASESIDESYIPSIIQRVGDDVIVNSSTEGSTKKFKLTVDDSGTISAVEVTE